MPLCPTCGESAESMVYRNDSKEYPAGPEIKICHANDGAYLHVIGES